MTKSHGMTHISVRHVCSAQLEALTQGQYLLALRAGGEQGIAAFIMGDEANVKQQVVRAWLFAKAERDKAATIRYASVFGAGLVDASLHREALSPLNEAIHLAQVTPSVAFPSIAIYAKIDALAGIHNTARLSNSRTTCCRSCKERSWTVINRRSTSREEVSSVNKATCRALRLTWSTQSQSQSAS